MMSNVNVFGSRMLNRIFGNIDCTHIVTENGHGPLIDAIVTQHLLHPKQLSAATADSYVFGFGRGQGDRILLFAHPGYKITTDIKIATIDAFPIIGISSLISIGVTDKIKIRFFEYGTP